VADDIQDISMGYRTISAFSLQQQDYCMGNNFVQLSWLYELEPCDPFDNDATWCDGSVSVQNEEPFGQDTVLDTAFCDQDCVPETIDNGPSDQDNICPKRDEIVVDVKSSNQPIKRRFMSKKIYALAHKLCTPAKKLRKLCMRLHKS
jgi:hypothetical protein